MNNPAYQHTFHIPVMGIGYTIDTPLKVAHYGISSVISLVDDVLMEKMREFYSKKLKLPFQSISNQAGDYRARRITAYLNLVDMVSGKKFEKLKNALPDHPGVRKYRDMLPDTTGQGPVHDDFHGHQKNRESFSLTSLTIGNIDVNIMTKLDRENYRGQQQLPSEYNDAHAALRGYAKSTLRSSLVLSAGMNPGLYSYLEEFDDFYPDDTGTLSKKITLKVSDYRSALIQGKYLAKKGLWVSEYRIESGLNCGGHAFATDGYLLGPILEEFKQKREELIRTTHELLGEALTTKRRSCPATPLPVKFSVQGGVGTAEEHRFLLEHYELDSVGWGTPFLLVPEVVNVDAETQQLLRNAREKDLYLSDTSPLGVPFNTLWGNTRDIEKTRRIISGRPGSPCPRKFASNNKEFTRRSICTASRQYQRLKIRELDSTDLPLEEYKREYDKATVKSCICAGLGTSALLVKGLDTKTEGKGVSVCPGPNMAYFSETVSLQKMADHIYGRTNLIERKDRPNMFIKEADMYIDHLSKKMLQSPQPLPDRQRKALLKFQHNLMEGINYYIDIFSSTGHSRFLYDLKALEYRLNRLQLTE